MHLITITLLMVRVLPKRGRAGKKSHCARPSMDIVCNEGGDAEMSEGKQGGETRGGEAEW